MPEGKPDDNEELAMLSAVDRKERDERAGKLAAAPPQPMATGADDRISLMGEGEFKDWRRKGFGTSDSVVGTQLTNAPSAITSNVNGSCDNCGVSLTSAGSYTKLCLIQRRMLRFCNDGQACLKRKQAGVKDEASKAKERKPVTPQGSLF
jgi:hypothetical protein